MPRIARVVAEGVAHHVTQRGNGCQQIFRSPADFALYKDLLMRYAERSGLVLWAYCLMPNHIHLVCVPMGKESLPSALGRTHADYAKHFNIARRTCGHVWQARYFSCPMDRWHCWRAMAYVERNPVRAGLVTAAAEYPWSSAAAHTGWAADPMVDLVEWRSEYDAARWSTVLTTSIDEEAAAERVRQATLRGRPLGDEAFVQSLEEITRRCLHYRRAGRPRHDRTNAATASGQDQLALEIGV